VAFEHIKCVDTCLDPASLCSISSRVRHCCSGRLATRVLESVRESPKCRVMSVAVYPSAGMLCVFCAGSAETLAVT
jgi:hypothetical protein